MSAYEVTTLIREAVELHLESLHAQGESVPEPSTAVRLIDVA